MATNKSEEVPELKNPFDYLINWAKENAHSTTYFERIVYEYDNSYKYVNLDNLIEKIQSLDNLINSKMQSEIKDQIILALENVIKELKSKER